MSLKRAPDKQRAAPASGPDEQIPSEGAALDRTDRRILAVLQANGRLSNVNLADRVGLSPSPCMRRVKRLEAEGYIEGYSAQLNMKKMGLGVTVFVHVSILQHVRSGAEEFRDAVTAVPEVVACHAVSGAHDFVLIVSTQDLESYSRLNKEVLLRLPNVSKIESTFSLDLVKHSVRLPLEVLPAFRSDPAIASRSQSAQKR
jgi:Lrp/AsnC family transcriptional regulator, leucine-responsive regulatory protein